MIQHSIRFLTIMTSMAGFIPPAAAETAAPRCIETAMLDHTRIVDDQTILFYMRNGTILKNTLDYRCFGLKFSTRGISYVIDNAEICANLQSFTIRDTGKMCNLGSFTPYTPQTPAH